MGPSVLTALQMSLGAGLVLVAALVPGVREDQLAFGTLIGLGSGMVTNAVPSLSELGKRISQRPPPHPPSSGK